MGLFGRRQDGAAVGRQGGYERFWGRQCDLVAHGSDETSPHIDVFRFPPGKRRAPMGADYVYISGGMSDVEQPQSEHLSEPFRRIEITTFSHRPGPIGLDGQDLIAAICHHVAAQPFSQGTCFAPGHTFDWGGPLLPGSQMEGFYLAGTPFIDRAALAKAAVTATFFLHLVPVSRSELQHEADHGVEALLDLFADQAVEQYFDLERTPVV